MAKGMAEYARSSKAKAVTILVTEGNNAWCGWHKSWAVCRTALPENDKTYTDYRLFCNFKEKFRKNWRDQDHFRIACEEKVCTESDTGMS